MNILKKEVFVDILEKIQEQEAVNDAISRALEPVCEGNGFFYNGGNLYLSALMELLKISMQDFNDYITWWLYETDDRIVYIDRKPQEIKTASQLYDFLVAEAKEMEKTNGENSETNQTNP